MSTMTTATTTEPGTAEAVQLRVDGEWLTICPADRLTPGRGIAALLPDGRQAALFRDRTGRCYAIDNRDPFTGAAVLSRGLVGCTAEHRVFVASPLLKQRFDLTTGECLDEDGVTIAAYEVRLVEATA